ncbi:YciI family protein [Terrabacter sp. NPDC080008]|uniref:YciI family protein n=1 Tax=Terrabacter sp. NPDC080008 TaxID=3155176 RepID=UPI00344D9F75
MADTYAYLIHEADWDSDAFLEGRTSGAGPAGKDPAAPGRAPEDGGSFPEHRAFQKAVAELGARIVGGAALQHTKHGGTVTRGDAGRRVEDAVWTDGPFPDSSEVITGFYLVETDDEDTARRIAALVPTTGHTEWRKVFPTGM